MLSAAAKEEGVFLIGGSIPERRGDKLYNTSTVFNPQGDMIHKYAEAPTHTLVSRVTMAIVNFTVIRLFSGDSFCCSHIFTSSAVGADFIRSRHSCLLQLRLCICCRPCCESTVYTHSYLFYKNTGKKTRLKAKIYY